MPSYRPAGKKGYSKQVARLLRKNGWRHDITSPRVDYSDDDKVSRIRNRPPKGIRLGNKYSLWMHLKRDNIMPMTYVIKNKQYVGKQPPEVFNRLWYLKIPNKDMGLGVFLVGSPREALNKVKDSKTYLLQEGVRNPLLYQGRKFDLRIHILFVAKDGKVLVYLHKNGYMRVSGNKYTEKNKGKFIHITNNMVQYKNPRYSRKTGQIPFKRFKDYNRVYPDLRRSVVTVCQRVIRNMAFPKTKCILLAGFDYMFDTNYKSWLIEANIAPGIRTHPDTLDLDIIEGRLMEAIYNYGINTYFQEPKNMEDFDYLGSF